MQKMTLREIADACGGQFVGDAALLDDFAHDIKIDSRAVKQGDLFIAVKGERLDGHDYIDSACENGSVCVITEKRIDHAPYILVASTFAALKDIAESYRVKMGTKVVAITGSVGKTTAKEMIALVLAQKFDVMKTEGNFNNEFGLPQTIFRIEPHHDVAVVEMGMSGFGEIRNLSRIAKPDVAVIMNIGESHIGNLGSRDGIFAAKCEIFEHCRSGALAVLNGDDDKLVTLERDGAVFFGKGSSNDVSVRQIIKADMRGTELVADVFGEAMTLFIPKPGEYLIYPALAAVAIGKRMGLTAAQIRRGIADFVPVGMRMDVIDTGRITIINDAYNACKQSMLAGAGTLKFADGRKVAILGDILELGEFGADIHFETGRLMGSLGLDLIICVGKLARHIADGAEETSAGVVRYFETQEALFEQLDALITVGDTVFVKASRGMKFENIVEKLRTL